MAYFAGWVFQKETKWADDVNDHILLCHQVRHTNKHSTLHLNISLVSVLQIAEVYESKALFRLSMQKYGHL